MRHIDRVHIIREAERSYHEACYEQHGLYEPGSWLHKPVGTVMRLLDCFRDYRYLSVLDLGSGVGRNSIAIAQSLKDRDGKVVCVDLLASALEKLLENSRQFGVERHIETRLSDLDHFAIEENAYNYIIAVSALEHIRSAAVLDQKLKEMTRGTKPGGMNCMILGSGITETIMETGEELDPMFEINMLTDDMFALLDERYKGWEIVERTAAPQTFQIERSGRAVQLCTNAITYAARRPTM